MNIAVLARRNLTRNKRRTAITICGAAFAATIMIAYGALMDGMIGKMVNSLTQLEIGQIQIHAPDYRDEPDLYKVIDHPQQILTALKSQGVIGTERLHGFALGSTEDTSVGVQIRGVDPAGEQAVTTLPASLAQGKWLDPHQPAEVVVGRTLAKNLGLALGQELVLFGQAADGSLASDLVTVRGILKGVSSAIDRGAVIMTLAKFREFFLVAAGAHEIALVASSDATSLSDAVAIVKNAAPDQEVLSWKELRPMFADMMEMSTASMAFMIVLIYIALGLLIINSTFMGIFERMRELGVLRAIGMTPWQIVQLILWEAFWQMAVAGVLAFVLAVPAVFYLTHYGIDLRSFMDNLAVAGMSLEPIWYGEATTLSFVMPLAFLLVVVMVASLYPALKAARVNPVEAIYDR